MPKKQFIHPKSREALQTVVKLNKERRKAGRQLEHRSATRRPVLAKLRWFQDYLRRDIDRTEYTPDELKTLATEYIIEMYKTEILPKLSVDKKARATMLAAQASAKELIDTVTSGRYRVPDITSPLNVRAIITWDNSMQTESGIKYICVRIADLPQLLPK
ncbi:Translation machinery-associated protein 16 [Giardia muris]|uniref:Translation machinery-associated protein 16 n=1 Tax=Giardia muris TaxID=5742 RepID=A0A4Z1T9N4_GIAMU|nr:Translation machinery-associated protein 16 [Giardia muris]|eukprot:TNJ29229.1 Translation machinery-associated protein 16 [Giardia muris]